MPHSAVKTASRSDPTTQPSRPDSIAPTVSGDAEKKLARAARSARLTSAVRSDATPDLFAEDIERATFQAMNTDIRQGTLAGFELPEVFMAAVQSGVGGEGSQARRAIRAGTSVADGAPLDADSPGPAARVLPFSIR